MLPAQLVRARVRAGALVPLRPDRTDPLVLDLAEQVFHAFVRGAANRARLGDVLTELDDAVADSPDAKLARGLVRTAEHACETSTAGIEDPAALRLLVFHRAAQRAPLPLGTGAAAAVLAEVAAEVGMPAEEAADGLYADLPLEQRVRSFGFESPERLVDRYDVSQVQSLIAGAKDIQVSLDGPTMPRMRQLVRWIKFFRLLHTAHLDGSTLELRLDGPMSLFGPSSRYGTALAGFFPALLLQECPWTLRATVPWQRGPARPLTVTHADRYVSHYGDTGAYRSKVHEHFAARFAEADRGFTLTEGVVPVTIAERDVVFPDFTLTDPRGVAVHVEIVGYWHPDRLVQRLDAVDRAGLRNLVLAVGRKLASRAKAELPDHPQLVAYSEVLSVDRVLAAARRVVKSIGG